jgi:glycosyltransferase involved in cell wall biosynthesis
MPVHVRLDHDETTLSQGSNWLIVNPSDVRSIRSIAGIISRFKENVVLLQHEFKLYGGPDGENVLELLKGISAPVITTLHTVWPSFPGIRQRVFLEVLQRSNLVIVFSDRAAGILEKQHGLETSKVKVIPHGVPDVPFLWPQEVDYPGAAKMPLRFITAGLIRSAKGIQDAMSALLELKRTLRDFTYIICGADHPRSAGASQYREELTVFCKRHNLDKNVLFLNRFLPWEELIRVIQSCHFGILPYTSVEQSSSGVLALFLACGRPVISTRFQYAEAVINDRIGALVPISDVHGMASAIQMLASDATRRQRMMCDCYAFTREWVWRKVAQRHAELARLLCGNITRG